MPEAEGHAIVLGADGFLGRALVRRLAADGVRVTGIGRARGDLADWPTAEGLFRELEPAARIFHVVTRQRTGAAQYDLQGELLAINARIHLNVLEGWRLFRPEAKLVSTGSSCTYPDSSRPLTEDMFGLGPTHPSVRGYALAKQALAVGSAEYVRQYRLGGYLHCVLATMYGPDDHKEPDRSHFVGALLDRAAREKLAGAARFEVWGDPGTVREVLHVDDQVDAILAADRAFTNEILNCAADLPVTVGEVAEAVLEALRWEVATWSPPGSFQGAGYKLLDSGRFLQRTGWRPKISLEEGLRRLAEEEYPEAFGATPPAQPARS